MKFQCSECKAVFTEREALCENWRLPEKSFGCPSCKRFLRDPRKQDAGKFVLMQAKTGIISMAVVFTVFGSIWAIEDYFNISSTYMYVALLPVIIWYVYKNPIEPQIAEPYE